jgi:hypothetical protein
MSSVVILIPVYKPQLDRMESFSMDRSLELLQGRKVRFIGPQHLDFSYYMGRYPTVAIDRFAAPTFQSIAEYNRLLLSQSFYTEYMQFEFILILQTDAILLRDELDYWCQQPFDYVGAPWPITYELFVHAGHFEGDFGKHVKVGVGNGGLSLRRTAKCLALLREFPVELGVFLQTGSSEDLFFSVMGSLSTNFVVPNEITASLFSMEGRPSFYFHVNGRKLPMGAHAWLKNEPDFWSQHLPNAPEIPTSVSVMTG